MLQNRVVVAALAAFAALVFVGGLRALAAPTLLPRKPVEQRVTELENEVRSLQQRLASVEAAAARAPKLGYQDANK
jgi:hypothetical protein